MTEGPTLDAAIAAWAATEPAGAGDEAALLRILHHAETIACPSANARPGAAWFQPKPGWMLGGALAASLAIALLLVPRPQSTAGEAGAVLADGRDIEGGSVMLAEADVGTRAAFALLYTPTVEEEYQL